MANQERPLSLLEGGIRETNALTLGEDRDARKKRLKALHFAGEKVVEEVMSSPPEEGLERPLGATAVRGS